MLGGGVGGDILQVVGIAVGEEICGKGVCLLPVVGVSGGYLQCKLPYTVGDILRTTEGSLEPVSESESPLAVWRRLSDAINKVLDSVTLQDLVDEENARLGGDYVI